MALLNQEENLERLCQLIRRHFPIEVCKYGERGFKKLISDSGDRRLLFKLLAREISFDQYVVRVDCDTKGVKYLCKEDLINDKGISKHFFDEEQLKVVEACMKSLHNVKNIDSIKPDAIV